MQPTIPQTTIPSPPQRQISCPQCWQRRFLPCTLSGAPGDHLARYIAATRAGLLSVADLAGVVGGLIVIADHVIVLERRAACWYCDRTGLPLESCCEHHPDDLVCADRADCKDFALAQLAETRQA